MKMMPGLIPVVGRTDDEANDKLDHLNSLTDPVVAREFLSILLRADLSKFPLDEKMPDLKTPPLASGWFHNWIELAKKENLTLRQLTLAGSARPRDFSVDGLRCG